MKDETRQLELDMGGNSESKNCLKLQKVSKNTSVSRHFHKDWKTIEIGKIVKVLGGFAFKSSDFSAHGHPVIRISNLNGSLVDISDCARIPTEKVGNGDKYKLEPGDILIAMSGATTGKLGFVPDNLNEDWFLNQRVGAFRIKPDSLVDRSYFRLFLKTSIYQSHIWNLAAGAAQPNISSRQLESALIPLPPLEEQKRIARILDAADELRAKRRQALAELDTLLQSTFLDMFGDPVTNPKDWEKLQLEKVCDKVIDCPHSTPQWSESGVVCLRTSNLGKGEWDWTETRFITEEDYKERTKRSEIKPNDIILSREGTVGVLALVKEGMRLCMGQRLVQLRVIDSLIHPKFLLNLLLHDLDPERLNRLMAGSTSKHLNVKDLRQLSVLLPPLDLQQKFATIVEVIEQQKARMREHLAELDALFASLQHRAFNGEL